MTEENDGDKALHLPKGEKILTQSRRKARNVVAVAGERGGMEYRSLLDPLDFYVAKGLITANQYRAGDRLRKIFQASLLRERYVRMNYGEAGDGSEAYENMALAPRDYIRAVQSIADDRAAKVVRNVCCHGTKAGKAGQMEFLRMGLDDLAMHFRIGRRQD